MTHRARRLLVVLAALAGALLAACPSDVRSEGLDPRTLPEDVRPDYAVFAQRCSKCHSLARPLNSGIVDDDYWAMYVARMRRQPASGISQEDERVILRFLHFYSLEQRRLKASHASAPPAPSPDAASPPSPNVAPSSADAAPPISPSDAAPSEAAP